MFHYFGDCLLPIVYDVVGLEYHHDLKPDRVYDLADLIDLHGINWATFYLCHNYKAYTS